MRKIQFVSACIALFLVFNACSKSNSPSANAKTVQNLSGTYSLSGLQASIFGVTVNVLDSLPACERDNEVQLNSNMVINFIDSGTICVPPADTSGVWSLSQNTDTIYVTGSSLAPNANFISSWDGTTLVLVGTGEFDNIPATVTTTLVKK